MAVQSFSYTMAKDTWKCSAIQKLYREGGELWNTQQNDIALHSNFRNMQMTF